MSLPKIPHTIKPNGWCPGCGHGVFTRLIHEVLEEKALDEKNVCMVGVGCSANMHRCIHGGNSVECHHGRAPASAIAMKRLMPDVCIWTYQGDGDAYAIGMGETILAAHNGYPLSVFVINNCIYGMTGGQCGQTTLQGQVTTTTVHGKEGKPFNVMPVLQAIENVGYAARGTTATPAEVRKLKKYIAKAIDTQMLENKFAFVELVCPCPTNWNKTPVESSDWIMNEVIKHFPLGEFVK